MSHTSNIINIMANKYILTNNIYQGHDTNAYTSNIDQLLGLTPTISH